MRFFFFFKTKELLFIFHFGRANTLDHRTFLNRMEGEGPYTSVVCIFEAVALMPFILPSYYQGNRDPARFSIRMIG